MSSYTSYLSNILTQTTSRYNSLRKILLNNEEDGDTEDDSHISRVLRAYYSEKGQQLPNWLPPDPHDRKAVTPQPAAQQNSYFGRNPYGGLQQQQQAPAAASARGGILNDLWDSPSSQAAPQSSSLRAGRRMPGGGRSEPQATLSVPQARPLPSQRAGSYQSQNMSTSTYNQGFTPDPNPSPSGSSMGGGSAQDRLRARFGGRNGSGNLPPPTQTNDSYDPSNRSSANSRRYGRFG